MRMGKLMAAVAASSLIATPVMANSAAPLSVAKVANVKAATSTKKANKLAPAILIGVLATVAIIGGAVVLADSDDTPDSP